VEREEKAIYMGIICDISLKQSVWKSKSNHWRSATWPLSCCKMNFAWSDLEVRPS